MTEESSQETLGDVLKTTGCLEHHLAVQNCLVEQGDGAKCQDQIEAFKSCIKDATSTMATETADQIKTFADQELEKLTAAALGPQA